MKYIIVDDEPLAREGVRINAQQIPFLEEAGSFENAFKASEFISENQVDIIFLDIEMPGLNGLDFIRSLSSKPFVILTTAYPQFALEAFELDVIDYLVKPIKFERFYKAVFKVKEYHSLKEKAYPGLESDNDHLFIKADRQYVKLKYDDIDFIKGMKDYVVIHTENQKYMTAMNVKTIYSKLPPKLFARISRSYIVQVKKIVSIGNDEISLGNIALPLGPSYKEAFINDYVKSNLITR
ncbi:MAG: LytTR family DNA-binding domain-containing protein [Bacteroidia bacterium]|nr:LytTR family DNA-binding domain-containing protein [Bacteroidia bacterium]